MRFLFMLPSVLVMPQIAFASSGDVGSLKTEREMFPEVLETIVGKYAKHSSEFDKWQIGDRQAKLAADPNNVALVDDLSLAFVRSGDYDKAILALEGTKQTQPRSRDADATLGFAYFLKGTYEKALPPLDRALAADPDAHAGRDRYLRWLVEYLMEKPGRRLPFSPIDTTVPWPHRPLSFATFLRAKLNKDDLDLADAQAAVRGLVQLLRRGRESELLFEALGDVLCYSSDSSKPVAKRLAARAYLRAGYVRDNPGVRRGYITLAEWALVHRPGDRNDYTDQKEALSLMTRVFEEVEEASAWRSDYQAKENELIANSPDPEGEISRLSSEEPRVSDDPSDPWLAGSQAEIGRYVAFGALGLVVLIAGILLFRRIARRSRRPAAR
jgi:tetratricopeptide (TPR) repeat protein